MNDVKALVLVPAVLLAVGVLPLPYGFYTFLRLVVCLVCAILAYMEWKKSETVSPWSVALGLVAILFNPVFPVHLTKTIWAVLDLASAAMLVLYWWGLRGRT